MPRSPGRPAARAPVMARSRCARSGRCSVPAVPRTDDAQARATAERVARASYGKLIAYLAARTGDDAGAEDALSEAFAAALVDWPRAGLPTNPEAWLIAVARHRTIDAVRRRRRSEAAASHLEILAQGHEARTELRMLQEIEATAAGAKDIPDDRLHLMFACAH